MRGAKGLTSCRKCQERHQKCDANLPRCGPCERTGESCVRDGRKLKFRHGSSARYDAKFKRDQVWMKGPKASKVQYVDETPELQSYYSDNEDLDNLDLNLEEASTQSQQSLSPAIPREVLPDRWTSQPAQQLQINNLVHQQDEEPSTATSFHVSPTTQYSPFVASDTQRNLTTPTPSVTSQNSAFVTYQTGPRSTSASSSQALEAEYRRLADTAAAAIPNVESGLLSPEVWRKQFFWPNPFTTTQCACLMRYYIEELAPWFDVGDPARHFTIIVPQMARRCPPLLNAIFTAAARHLSLTSKYRLGSGHISFHGVLLRNLTSETALRYHNACLAYLIELSTDPKHVQDEDLLAAVAILQYYEELDSWLTGENTGVLGNTFRLFIDAQTGAAHSFPSHHQNTHHKPHDHDIYAGLPGVSPVAFRRASLRVALRHDIISAFVRQRPVNLPLEAWASLRSFKNTEDAIWTDRLAIFCTDVLQFCFGGENGSSQQQKEKWQQLREMEKMWDAHRLISFGPIHYQEASGANENEVFPQIWFLSEYHAVGIQYLDLARILLIVYDPTLPRLGQGASAAHRRMIEDTRKIMLRICGIAISNQPSQATLVLAAVASSVCGEHLSNDQERKGILGILGELEKKYAWRTSKTVQDLKQAWS